MSRKAITGLRANAFAVLIMLLLEFCLGTTLYGAVPASDHGLGVLAAFAAAIVTGPVMLMLHAILGSLIIISAITVVVRTILFRSTSHIVIGGVGLAATLIAWIAGTQAVGAQSPVAGHLMQLSTAAAMFCYALILFLVQNEVSTPSPPLALAGEDRTDQ